MKIDFRMNTVFIISAVFLFLTCIGSCKDPVIKDASLTKGANDLLNLTTTDTFTVNSKTVVEDAYSTAQVSHGLIGSMDDPIFGKTVCGFYAQCLLSADGSLFGNNPSVDSCVLSLVYYDAYGQNKKPITLAVYELNESLDPLSTSYFTNTSFAVKGSPIGIATNFVPNYTDSVHTINGTLAPQMRIRLNNSFGQRVLNTDSITLSSSANFVNLIKGLYVTTQGALGNGVSSVSFINSNVTIYYHNDASDTLRFTLPISSGAARVNHFDHVYTNTIQQALSSTAVSDSLIYVQSGAGVKVKVTFPTLGNLPSNFAINKAEVIVTRWNNPDTTYQVPAIISLQKINATGGIESFSALDYGGLAASHTENINGVDYTRYTFNVTEHLQHLLRGAYPNNGFYISLSSASKADRFILTNFKSDNNYRIRLKLTYTKLT